MTYPRRFKNKHQKWLPCSFAHSIAQMYSEIIYLNNRSNSLFQDNRALKEKLTTSKE